MGTAQNKTKYRYGGAAVQRLYRRGIFLHAPAQTGNQRPVMQNVVCFNVFLLCHAF